ncbi:hypothetical protein H257_01248 [Aphanomyces astaci]|uniref:Uncharacterized protein n=1 Tax=Aphanomyces astaci TaxID=112090 RepID=W4H930_APHAT|nr:hypothetical protein H257_01248 [Aphanomyces astaci]ETV87794.1 hypothetical protein H257_01248 [Aphanomyces astaci]|eukprot:XP_009822657.1 hypothetical protein H257_01248 [Aphanomyces astaci]
MGPDPGVPYPLSNLPYKHKREKLAQLGVVNHRGRHYVGRHRGSRERIPSERAGAAKDSQGRRWVVTAAGLGGAAFVHVEQVRGAAARRFGPALYDVVGTVTNTGTSSQYTPSQALPIFVGSGSMIIPDADATIQIIVDAAAGAHVALQSSWSDMTHGCLVHIPPNVFMLGN